MVIAKIFGHNGTALMQIDNFQLWETYMVDEWEVIYYSDGGMRKPLLIKFWNTGTSRTYFICDYLKLPTAIRKKVDEKEENRQEKRFITAYDKGYKVQKIKNVKLKDSELRALLQYERLQPSNREDMFSEEMNIADEWILYDDLVPLLKEDVDRRFTKQGKRRKRVGRKKAGRSRNTIKAKSTQATQNTLLSNNGETVGKPQTFLMKCPTCNEYISFKGVRGEHRVLSCPCGQLLELAAEKEKRSGVEKNSKPTEKEKSKASGKEKTKATGKEKSKATMAEVTCGNCLKRQTLPSGTVSTCSCGTRLTILKRIVPRKRKNIKVVASGSKRVKAVDVDLTVKQTSIDMSIQTESRFLGLTKGNAKKESFGMAITKLINEITFTSVKHANSVSEQRSMMKRGEKWQKLLAQHLPPLKKLFEEAVEAKKVVNSRKALSARIEQAKASASTST